MVKIVINMDEYCLLKIMLIMIRGGLNRELNYIIKV